MDAADVPLDCFLFSTVITLYIRKGMQYEEMCMMKEAAQLHRDLVVADVEPGTVTYTTLVDDVGKAVRLRGEMEARGMLLSVATCNAIVRKLCEDRKIKGSMWLLDEMDERKVQAFHVTFNTLINSYSKKGDMGLACKSRGGWSKGRCSWISSHTKLPSMDSAKGTQLDEAKDALFEKLGAVVIDGQMVLQTANFKEIECLRSNINQDTVGIC
ncbi:hypothetical protein QYE76_049728 [Lolium multiflorum]|uniref:Pentatricopeptide repeat-containing protein n=1 Tax=Lolium multiflorum TaxID=4521 RepID=A0AAD8WGL2_LOLMU|nr:hypothetical protein QYE76_049728 [Lolium multiflorum]